MPENPLPAVNSISVESSKNSPLATRAAYVDQVASASKGTEPVNEPTDKAQANKAEPEPKKEPSPASKLLSISLEFQVDESTNDVTVVVLDKSSHKVIRTIPADELKNLREGDLFELSI